MRCDAFFTDKPILSFLRGPCFLAKLGYFNQWWFCWFQCDKRCWNATHSSVQKRLELCNFRAPFFTWHFVSKHVFVHYPPGNYHHIYPLSNPAQTWVDDDFPFFLSYWWDILLSSFPGRVMEQQLTTPQGLKVQVRLHHLSIRCHHTLSLTVVWPTRSPWEVAMFQTSWTLHVRKWCLKPHSLRCATGFVVGVGVGGEDM